MTGAASVANQGRAAPERKWGRSVDSVTRAKKPVRLPTVLTADEVKRIFEYLDDPLMDLIVRLLYGTGMHLLVCLRLRTKDVEFTRREIVVREGKGNKDRVKMLPDNLTPGGMCFRRWAFRPTRVQGLYADTMWTRNGCNVR